jgi:predicted nucleotidyltransferase component of viral defense system
MKDSRFFQQALLMLRVLPYVTREDCFALKGGTAINLFVRDLTRLSVDIDLTYLPVAPREESLNNISQALTRIADAITQGLSGAKVQPSQPKGSKRFTKIFIKDRGVQIKIEPNEIIRGTISPSRELGLSKKAQDLFELDVSSQILSFEDLYGGKICAALDRQHPRDLFDVKLLLENEGFNEKVRKAFVVYLISHNRPIHELLDPQLIDIKIMFEEEFSGMTDHRVSCEDLVEARRILISKIKSELSEEERKFILSVKEMNPQWELLSLEGVEKLPAVQWKLENLRKMGSKARERAVKKLREALDF